MKRSLEYFNAISVEDSELEIDKAIALTKLDPNAVSFDDLSNLIDKTEMDEATKEAARIQEESNASNPDADDESAPEDDTATEPATDETDESGDDGGAEDTDATEKPTADESEEAEDKPEDLARAQEAIAERFEFIHTSLEKLEEINAISDKIEAGISNGGVSQESYVNLKNNLKTIYNDMGVDDTLIATSTSTESYASFARRVKVSKEAIQEIKDMVKHIWKAIANTIRSIVNWISKAIKSFLSEFRQTKQDLLKITQALGKMTRGDSGSLKDLSVHFREASLMVYDMNKVDRTDIKENQTRVRALVGDYSDYLSKATPDIVKFSQIPDTLEDMHFPVNPDSHPDSMTKTQPQKAWFSNLNKNTTVVASELVLGNKRLVAAVPKYKIVVLTGNSGVAKDKADDAFLAAVRSSMGFKTDETSKGTDSTKVSLAVMGKSELSQFAVDSFVVIKGLEELVVQFKKQESIVKNIQAFADRLSALDGPVSDPDKDLTQLARRYRAMTVVLNTYYIEPTFVLIRTGKAYANASNEYCLRCIKSYL